MEPPSAGSELPTDAFDYALPADRIAQEPLAERDQALLLHCRPNGVMEDRRFTDLPALLAPGDLVVANDVRVRAARLRGTRAGGGAAEILILERLAGSDRFVCMVRPGRRLTTGDEVHMPDGMVARIEERAPGHPGARVVQLQADDGNVDDAIERHGEMPLPPYIRRRLDDRERYQTTYSSGPAVAAAAPTAGLHFTPSVRDALVERGVGWTTVHLDVGLGTFAPIRTDRIGDHSMHVERFELSPATAAAIAATRRRGGRVVAVGTTSVRVLETCAAGNGQVLPKTGETGLYLRPGMPVRVVDALLTNFHQPRSSLLVLLGALMGMSAWRAAYDHALTRSYRFLSFGDCMLAWIRRDS